MKRLHVIVIISVAVVFAGVLALAPLARKQYRVYALRERLQEAIARDAGYTETILKIEKDAPAVTYQEVFDLCDKSVSKRTDLISEVRGLYPDLDTAAKQKVIDYLNAVNGFVRCKKAFFAAHFKLSKMLDTKAQYLRRSDEYHASLESDIRRRDTDSGFAHLNAWKALIREGSQFESQIPSSRAEVVSTADAYTEACNELADIESESEKALRLASIPFKPIFRAYHRRSVEDAQKQKQKAQAPAKL